MMRASSMEAALPKPNLLSNIFIRLLSFGVLVLLARSAYVITVKGKACDSASEFCFFGETLKHDAPAADGDTATSSASAAGLRSFYSSVFQDLIAEGFLWPDSNCICIETPTGQDVGALIDIGVTNSIGISRKASPPLVRYGLASRHPFSTNNFDFEFSGHSGLDRAVKPAEFASEVSRTLKPGGFFVVHTTSKDEYSFHSLLRLFSSFDLVRSREINGVDSSLPWVREIVLQKQNELAVNKRRNTDAVDGKLMNNMCNDVEYKHEILRNAEPLIGEEPLKPWLALKRNIKNVKYLSSMVDIRFKNRYVYVDVGARSYGSSIGSWFKKQYPKQNKTFEVYAIEADKAFYDDYKSRKGVKFLPYAAWVRNETLFFEINREPSKKNEERGRGMGRIQGVQSSSNFVGNSDKIQGFDFAAWLKETVTEKDYVLVKMDVEGTEFHLIPRLIETGAICLIDEMFLECHYNRWQRCCPGVRSPKYQNTYDQCLDLFNSLRKNGVLVHQWW
ncbi:OLC1v1006365C1 [Oldenlandia corymbosa var. corymbosa]|uniref:OLC1v1006365C1 n=1 Tax=Oldenlandia corymbosa var. corymbosa TaxID=529605 RepID=A0AAV1DJG5_OLDCO|nr:OLC1v1006365C1 [Oldenlandia corymbosa var. corymbosa]